MLVQCQETATLLWERGGKFLPEAPRTESRRGLHEIFGINVVGNFSIAMMALEFQCHCCSRISPLETGTAEE